MYKHLTDYDSSLTQKVEAGIVVPHDRGCPNESLKTPDAAAPPALPLSPRRNAPGLKLPDAGPPLLPEVCSGQKTLGSLGAADPLAAPTKGSAGAKPVEGAAAGSAAEAGAVLLLSALGALDSQLNVHPLVPKVDAEGCLPGALGVAVPREAAHSRVPKAGTLAAPPATAEAGDQPLEAEMGHKQERQGTPDALAAWPDAAADAGGVNARACWVVPYTTGPNSGPALASL
ncbi:hypothetical protein WJX77_006532 [Trebouxia sp. C0004]